MSKVERKLQQREMVVEKEKSILRELFGSHKFKKPIDQLMKEMDEELDSEF